MRDHETKPVETAVPAAILSTAQATRPREASSWQARLPPHRRITGFTLAELLVTVGVLALLVLLFTQLINSTASITALGHKQIDADSQARQLLDRMNIDFAQLVKRSDVDYYVKSSATAPLRRAPQLGNDQVAFYSSVPGYYPPSGSQSPVSLVAYRVNAQNKLERMGKGLVWNAVSTTDTPVVFIPVPVASPLPSPLPSPMPNPSPTPAWPQAGNMTADSDYELIGPQVFRFEYYYLLKNGASSDIPWDTGAGNNAVNGMQDIAAIIVDIAVIDPKSKVLLTDAQLATLTTPGNANFLADYSSGMTPGQLRSQWQNKVNGITTLPRPALSGIRFYERYFYLSQ
jgi:hypothetical protein